MGVGVVILSGGESRRFQRPGMGGRDKALGMVRGKRMVEWVIDVAHEVSDDIVLVVGDKEQVERYSHLFLGKYPGLRIMADMKGVRGSPLVGLITGALASNANMILVLPCDLPFIKAEVLNMLMKKAVNTDATLPFWPDGKVEPLVAVYRRALMALSSPALLHLERGRPDDLLRASVKSYLINVEAMRDLDPALESFININYPDDIKGVRLQAPKSGPLKEGILLRPNRTPVGLIKGIMKGITSSSVPEVKGIGGLKEAPFWRALLSLMVWKWHGNKWLEIGGEGFEAEAEYYAGEGVQMVARHAFLDALHCWQTLGYAEKVAKVSAKVEELKRCLGIDFEGKSQGSRRTDSITAA